MLCDCCACDVNNWAEEFPGWHLYLCQSDEINAAITSNKSNLLALSNKVLTTRLNLRIRIKDEIEKFKAQKEQNNEAD
jgi:hypothetical protein